MCQEPGRQPKARRAPKMKVSKFCSVNQVIKTLSLCMYYSHAASEPTVTFWLNDKDQGQLWRGLQAFTQFLCGRSEGDGWELPTGKVTPRNRGQGQKVMLWKFFSLYIFYKFRTCFFNFLKENQWVSLTTW